jgi:hypothetical protein
MHLPKISALRGTRSTLGLLTDNPSDFIERAFALRGYRRIALEGQLTENAKFWGVYGGRVEGPYDQILEVKTRFGVSGSYDQAIPMTGTGRNVYRYGTLFVGRAGDLMTAKISQVPAAREAKARRLAEEAARIECPKPSIESIKIDPLGNTFDVTWRQEVRNPTGFAVTTRRYGYEGLVS